MQAPVPAPSPASRLVPCSLDAPVDSFHYPLWSCFYWAFSDPHPLLPEEEPYFPLRTSSHSGRAILWSQELASIFFFIATSWRPYSCLKGHLWDLQWVAVLPSCSPLSSTDHHSHPLLIHNLPPHTCVCHNLRILWHPWRHIFQQPSLIFFVLPYLSYLYFQSPFRNQRCT